MIVWDKLTIANATAQSGITITPVSASTLQVGGSIVANAPLKVTYVSDTTTLSGTSLMISADGYNGVNLYKTGIMWVQEPNSLNIDLASGISFGANKTLITSTDVTAQNIAGTTTVTGGTGHFTNVTVDEKLSVDQIGTDTSPVSNLYSKKIDLKQQPPISTYTSDNVLDERYKINLRYSSENLDTFAVLPANNREGTEYAEMNIVRLFDRIYDIYFMVGGKDAWVTGNHEDGWWFFEAPQELRSIMQSGLMVNKQAYQYEKRSTQNPDSRSLRDYTSQWLVSYFYSYSTEKWYLALGLDSHTSGDWCKISGMAHIRVIR